MFNFRENHMQCILKIGACTTDTISRCKKEMKIKGKAASRSKGHENVTRTTRKEFYTYLVTHHITRSIKQRDGAVAASKHSIKFHESVEMREMNQRVCTSLLYEPRATKM
jgi:hypothetical protein